MSAKVKRNILNIGLLLCQPVIFSLMRTVSPELFLETPLGYALVLTIDTFIMSFITVPSGWQHGRRMVRLVSIQCGVFAILTLILGWDNHTTIQKIISPLMLGVFGAAPLIFMSITKD